MRRGGFYIIRCPRCGRYTYAPVRQKTRLCVYCQRIFKVNPLNAQFVEEATTARTLVKLYQTGKHHKEFLAAVEQSRVHVTSLIPSENVSLETLKEQRVSVTSSAARRRLLEMLLHQKVSKNAVDLHIFEEECKSAGLPWNWVVKQLEHLIRSGHIVCPRPWQIRLVTPILETTTISSSPYSLTKLARKIGEIVRDASTPISQMDLMAKLEHENITNTQLEEALELLRNQGYILKTTKGYFRWSG